MRISWVVGAAAVLTGIASSPVWIPAPAAHAVVCGSVGGLHVDITGCSDPLSVFDDFLAPPPPGAAPPPPPPPPVYVPHPDVSVCADVGRRINVSGCI